MKLLRTHLFLVPFLFFANLACAQTAIVAVAANMKDAFNEINTAFKAAGNPEMKIVYGSSGNLATQIINGAPFSLFISADEQFPLELYKKGKTLDEGVVYANGQLAMITKKSGATQFIDSKTELSKAIHQANKIAIAKPQLAPYGRAAVEYLKAEGLWDIAKDKLIYGDNVGITSMYVVTGAADLGFTALSLASSAELTKDTNFVVLSQKLYEPIRQRMVLIKGALPPATMLYQFMQGTQAKLILRKYGYNTP